MPGGRYPTYLPLNEHPRFQEHTQRLRELGGGGGGGRKEGRKREWEEGSPLRVNSCGSGSGKGSGMIRERGARLEMVSGYKYGY